MTTPLTEAEIARLYRECGDGGPRDYAHVEVPTLRALLDAASRVAELEREVAEAVGIICRTADVKPISCEDLVLCEQFVKRNRTIAARPDDGGEGGK